MSDAFEIPTDLAGPVVTTAIHAGHELRPEVSEMIVLDERTRLREEDPFTDLIAAGAETPVVANRSRFEVDLNRPRDRAVYSSASESWGLDPWKSDVPGDVAERSLAVHDEFYSELAQALDRLATRGPFVVFDVHSYNHRRGGVDAPPAPAAENPEVNVGTGSLGRDRWAPVVAALVEGLRETTLHGRCLDVRENVKFEGAQLARWIHQRYPGRGCALALEFKKTFMDEWTGAVDPRHLVGLQDALADVVPAVSDSLERVPNR